MTIFLRELIRNRKTFIIWAVISLVFCIYALALYPYMYNNMDIIIQKAPPDVMKAFGMSDLNMQEILGYFGGYAYQFVGLFGAIFITILAAGILSKEEGEKTIEFLLAKPVTRKNIVTGKLLSVLFYMGLFNAVVFIADLILIESVKKSDYDMKVFLLLSAGMLLLQLTFASIGFLLSVFIVKAKSIMPAAVGIVLGGYMLNMLAGLSEKTEYLKYITPFKYVNAGDIIRNGGISWVYLLIMAVVVTGCIAAAYILYDRKNITV